MTDYPTRITMDAAVMAAIGAVIIFFCYIAEPHHRGFFCNDPDLSFPALVSSVPSWVLYLLGSVLPFFVVAAVEWLRVPKRYRDAKGVLGRVYCYYFIWFGFGAMITAAITHTVKMTTGRLRPHFFAVCQPDFAALEPLCSRGVYIVDYNCTNTKMTSEQATQIHVSFPSSHSSYGFHAAVFIVLYVQKRWTSNKGSVALRPFFQVLPIVGATLVAISRVSDFKHFPSDVAAGALLGAIVAIFSYFTLGATKLYEIYSGDEDLDESGSTANNNSGGIFFDGDGDVRSNISRCRETSSNDFVASLTRSGRVKPSYRTFLPSSASAAQLLVP